MDAAPATGAQLVGVRAYARMIGVTPGTISRQVASGAIPNRGTRDKPLIDPEEATKARARNLNPLKARRRGAVLGYERSLAEHDAQLMPPTDDQDEALDAVARADSDRHEAASPVPRLAQAATAEKAIRAQLLQLELEEKKGTVCDVAGVERGAAMAVADLHDALRQRNRELAERVARLTDPAAIEALLAESDRVVLARWAAALNNKLGTNKVGLDEDRHAA